MRNSLSNSAFLGFFSCLRSSFGGSQLHPQRGELPVRLRSPKPHLSLRRPLTAWLPWLWALAVILWNETVDLWIEQWPDPGQQYGEGAKDLLLTMALPTLLMCAARVRPDLFRAGVRKRRGR